MLPKIKFCHCHSANIADMRIPSQITGDNYLKILDTFDVFEEPFRGNT